MTEAGETDREAVLDTVRRRVTPDQPERDRLAGVVSEAVDRAKAAVADLPIEAEVRQVGSTARDTWLAGDRDVDIFVCFPPSLDRSTLEEYGLRVGHAVLPDGHEEFAEHPYVVGTIEGFEVDLVPCYDVDAATEIQSSVDRTPFHSAYLEERVDEETAVEIRMCKQFLTGVGIYGSDLRTRGFSGYLTELLVLEFGDFASLVEAGADWVPPVRIDPASHGTGAFDDALVVIDPTDPDRNVAAVLTAENLARFQHHARSFLREPRVGAFEPTVPDPMDAPAVRSAVDRRETTPVALLFDAPDVVDDQLWPQLRRSLESLTDALDRRGFDPIRSDAFAGERAVLLVELEVGRRPAIERHEGPPVHIRDHAERFLDAYADRSAVFGPFVDGDRYVVERDRSAQRPTAFLESDAVFELGLGADVEAALQTGYDVLVGSAVASTAEEFGREWARYFDPTP